MPRHRSRFHRHIRALNSRLQSWYRACAADGWSDQPSEAVRAADARVRIRHAAAGRFGIG